MHGLQQQQELPVYFDRILASFDPRSSSRNAHLGHWDLPYQPSKDATLAEFQEAQERLNDQLVKLANLVDGEVILDVACGLGGLIQRLNEQFSQLCITGINIDYRQLERCHQIHAQRGNSLRWIEANACQLPVPDSSVDAVFCVEAMFHFASRRQFLKEANRVLKPGGRLVVSDVSLHRNPDLPEFCLEAVLNDGYGPWPDPWCEDGSVLELLQADSSWGSLQHIDATGNTFPSYQWILPSGHDSHRDPCDPASRSAMLLHWMHKNGQLRYDYLKATKETG